MRELSYLTFVLSVALVVNAAGNDISYMTLDGFLKPLKDAVSAAEPALEPQNAVEKPSEKPIVTTTLPGAAVQDNGSNTIGSIITTSEYSSLRPPLAQAEAMQEASNGAGADVMLLPPIIASNIDDQLKQRIVTYDQRQEGQYNLRADLENFMIVLVPPGSEQSLSLLDLLTKSNLRRASSHAIKGRRKQFLSRATLPTNGIGGSGSGNSGHIKSQSKLSVQKYSPDLEQGFVTRDQQQQHQQPSIGRIAPNGDMKSEFIEGRTPYHVDISASDEAQSRLQPDRQVDVLPPSYYPQLPFKPIHLEADQAVIKALPPSDIGRYNQLLEVGNGAGGSGAYNHPISAHQSLPLARSFYRDARAIRGPSDNLVDSNRLIKPTMQEPTLRVINVPIYRSDLGNKEATPSNSNSLYPPIDTPDYQAIDNTRTWRLMDVADEHWTPRHLVRNFDMDFDLIDDAFDESKLLLLGDGLERCAPGHRRDSYGVCREIEGY